MKKTAMEAKELMIGNWVQIDDLPPEQITLDTFAALKMMPATISKFNGIPLTEEILRKCGFENHSKFYNALTHPHMNCRWVTHKFSGPSLDVPFLRFDSTGQPPYSCTDVYYLHQLQNIYFALTGTELEYKP